MEKLVDVFGTKYFAAHWTHDLSAYLAEYGEADLADARFVTATANVLSEFQHKGAYLIDSLNKHRNRILEENRKRLKKQSPMEYLPILTKYDDLPEYLESLETNKEFSMRSGNIPLFLLGIVVQIYRPDISIDFSTYYVELFEYIRTYLQWIKKHDKLYMLFGATFSVEEVEDGCIYIPLQGRVEYDEAIRRFPLIPYDFGNVPLDGELEWSFLIDRVLLDLEYSMGATRKTMKDYCLEDAG